MTGEERRTLSSTFQPMSSRVREGSAKEEAAMYTQVRPRLHEPSRLRLVKIATRVPPRAGMLSVV